MTRSFYEAATPGEALDLYRRGEAEPYAWVKNLTIRRFLRRHLAGTAPGQVLEVGAGGGHWTGHFLAQNWRVVCVDTCSQVLAANQAAHPQAICVEGDASVVDLGHPSDLVFAKDIIEHIADDQRFLRNMHRHLRPGGHIFLNTQNAASLNFLLQGGYHALRGDVRWRGWDPTHVRFYTPWSLSRLLRQTGFRPLAWVGSYYLPYRLAGPRRLHRRFFRFEATGLNESRPWSVTGWNIGVWARRCP